MELPFRGTVIHRAFGSDDSEWPSYVSNKVNAYIARNNDRKKHTLDVAKMEVSDVEKIRDACSKLLESTKDYYYQNLRNKINTFLALVNDIKGEESAKKLEHIPIVIKNFVAFHCPHRFL